jgi:DNA polymerase III delta prime subunit
MSNKVLWVERYRPSKLEDYVWSDAAQKEQVMAWVKDGNIPNLLLSGSAGVGKTTLAKCLFNELGVDPTDIRYVNASHNTGVDYYRGLSGFIETMPSGDFRYILLDEADYLSPNAQAALRSMMEEYSNVCRWVLTCNYPHKIIPALHSRTQGFHIEDLDRELFATRTATILLTEGIDLNEENLEILDEYITVTYPDLRKCINLLQQNCTDSQLKRPSARSTSGSADYMVAAVGLFKSGKIHEARKLLCANVTPEEYEDLYKLLYRNLSWWGATDDQQNRAIVTIANRLRDHALCADGEMNLAACLIELSLIAADG